MLCFSSVAYRIRGSPQIFAFRKSYLKRTCSATENTPRAMRMAKASAMMRTTFLFMGSSFFYRSANPSSDRSRRPAPSIRGSQGDCCCEFRLDLRLQAPRLLQASAPFGRVGMRRAPARGPRKCLHFWGGYAAGEEGVRSTFRGTMWASSPTG